MYICIYNIFILIKATEEMKLGGLTVSEQGVHGQDMSPAQPVTSGQHTVQIQVPEDLGQVPEQRCVFAVVR